MGERTPIEEWEGKRNYCPICRGSAPGRTILPAQQYQGAVGVPEEDLRAQIACSTCGEHEITYYAILEANLVREHERPRVSREIRIDTDQQHTARAPLILITVSGLRGYRARAEQNRIPPSL